MQSSSDSEPEVFAQSRPVGSTNPGMPVAETNHGQATGDHSQEDSRHEMQRLIRALLSKTRPIRGNIKPLIEALSQSECRVAAAWTRSAHRRLMLVQWSLPPQPENFDHSIDLFYQWQQTRNPLWVERGVFGSLCLRGGRVLELCCGDGFNARNFYSLRCESVVGCDFDPLILGTARRKNQAPNLSYLQADIRTNMPGGAFDNIVWDAAIEHFTPDEIDAIMVSIKNRLTPDGVLSGYTVVEKGEGQRHLTHHEYEFKDKDDLKRFLAPHFSNVCVFETVYPGRHNLYFWASDGTIPFSPEWTGACNTWGANA